MGVSMYFVMSSAPALHNELQCIHNLTKPPGFLTADEQTRLRPESCWNDCLTRRKLIRPCVPSHVAYEVGAARQQTVRSPRTMDPHSQEWHRNREDTVYLPA